MTTTEETDNKLMQIIWMTNLMCIIKGTNPTMRMRIYLTILIRTITRSTRSTGGMSMRRDIAHSSRRMTERGTGHST